MIKPEQVPDIAAREAARADYENVRRRLNGPAYKAWDFLTADEQEGFVSDQKSALAAGLAAWPNAWTSESVGNGSLILPLPEVTNDQ